jgi:hypothetical protein
LEGTDTEFTNEDDDMSLESDSFAFSELVANFEENECDYDSLQLNENISVMKCFQPKEMTLFFSTSMLLYGNPPLIQTERTLLFTCPSTECDYRINNHEVVLIDKSSLDIYYYTYESSKWGNQTTLKIPQEYQAQVNLSLERDSFYFMDNFVIFSTESDLLAFKLETGPFSEEISLILSRTLSIEIDSILPTICHIDYIESICIFTFPSNTTQPVSRYRFPTSVSENISIMHDPFFSFSIPECVSYSLEKTKSVFLLTCRKNVVSNGLNEIHTEIQVYSKDLRKLILKLDYDSENIEAHGHHQYGETLLAVLHPNQNIDNTDDEDSSEGDTENEESIVEFYSIMENGSDNLLGGWIWHRDFYAKFNNPMQFTLSRGLNFRLLLKESDYAVKRALLCNADSFYQKFEENYEYTTCKTCSANYTSKGGQSTQCELCDPDHFVFLFLILKYIY